MGLSWTQEQSAPLCLSWSLSVSCLESGLLAPLDPLPVALGCWTGVGGLRSGPLVSLLSLHLSFLLYPTLSLMTVLPNLTLLTGCCCASGGRGGTGWQLGGWWWWWGGGVDCVGEWGRWLSWDHSTPWSFIYLTVHVNNISWSLALISFWCWVCVCLCVQWLFTLDHVFNSDNHSFLFSWVHSSHTIILVDHILGRLGGDPCAPGERGHPGACGGHPPPDPCTSSPGALCCSCSPLAASISSPPESTPSTIASWWTRAWAGWMAIPVPLARGDTLGPVGEHPPPDPCMSSPGALCCSCSPWHVWVGVDPVTPAVSAPPDHPNRLSSSSCHPACPGVYVYSSLVSGLGGNYLKRNAGKSKWFCRGMILLCWLSGFTS